MPNGSILHVTAKKKKKKATRKRLLLTNTLKIFLGKKSGEWAISRREKKTKQKEQKDLVEG